jgi:hypothetical protein
MERDDHAEPRSTPEVEVLDRPGPRRVATAPSFVPVATPASSSGDTPTGGGRHGLIDGRRHGAVSA